MLVQLVLTDQELPVRRGLEVAFRALRQDARSGELLIVFRATLCLGMRRRRLSSAQVVMRDRVTDKPRGFGFVTFADEDAADKVCAERHELQGRQVSPTTLQGLSIAKLTSTIGTKLVFTSLVFSADRCKTLCSSHTAT